MGSSVVLSLDFELRWGVFDILGEDMSKYRRNIEGVREVVPRLLEVFESRAVGATWAMVGAVACDGWDEWAERSPVTPRYTDANLRWQDVYRKNDPTGALHFAPKLVELIRAAKHQELGSHTFNHIYLREPGATREDVVADSDAVVRLFQDRWGQSARSFVFPRNQVAHTDVLSDHGIRVWRENPTPFYWNATAAKEGSRAVRLLRFSDSVLPMGRRRAPQHTHRASYFVRVGLPSALWKLHCARIRRDARRLRDGETLHLWWHPHNLGDDPRGKAERIAELLDIVRDASPRSTFAPMSTAS